MISSRFRYLVVLALSAFCVGLMLNGALRSQQATNNSKSAELKAWEFPGAKSQRSGQVGGAAGEQFADDYATPKPFEEVWKFYAQKLGYKKEYVPGGQFSGSGASGYQILIWNASEPVRPQVLSSTLIGRDARGGITVFISRAKNEDKTYFTLIIDKK